MSAGQNASLGVASSSLGPPIITITTTTTAATISEREQTKIDFYQTYDAMTGIRIAATLGGFFGLMVILVVYKSKSKTEKALEDPKLAAAAVAQAEEEEQRQIQVALEATVFQQMNPRAARRSLDISNSPANWVRSTTRFSSVGGYSSLMEPPVRMHSRLPCFINEDSPPDEDEFDELSTCDRYLNVPRRSSNITCSSSDSSYLERRGSSVILGLPAVPAHKFCNHRRQSSPLPEQYDFYYPIDIRVIQPTPGGSPCGSERALYDNIPVTKDVTKMPQRRAPLASISSCNSSLVADYPDLDMQSFASDSVFHEDDCPDTEDEVDPFSTDSETSEGTENAWCRRGSKGGSYKRYGRSSIKKTGKERKVSIPCISENIPVINENRENEGNGGAGECSLNISEFRISVSEHDLNHHHHHHHLSEQSSSVIDTKSLRTDGSRLPLNVEESRSSSISMGSLPVSRRPPFPFPLDKSSDSLTLIESGNGSTVTLPTLTLMERRSSPDVAKKEGSWSQETLF